MPSGRTRVARIVGLALIVGAFFTAQEVGMDLARGHSLNAGQDLLNGLEFWAVWALLTPIVLIAVERWPLDAKPLALPLMAHVGLAISLAVVHSLTLVAVDAIAPGLRGAAVSAVRPTPVRCVIEVPMIGAGFRPVLSTSCGTLTAFVWGAFTGVVFYAIVVMVFSALRFRHATAVLEAELSQAKLDTLRSQLRPHFLFNTLNAISVFVTEDAEKAQHMLLRLSTLLRRSLDQESHEVPLRQELEFVTDYLDIQRGRFGDQLIVNLAVDPTALDARVPVFFLQPLLENAIEHGKSDDRPTTIALRATRDGEALHLCLEDDGPGLGNGTSIREGIGLRNTRARLHQLYGAQARVELRSRSTSGTVAGTRVDIRLPLRADGA
jgi:two-component system LytT family sensor kinase